MLKIVMKKEVGSYTRQITYYLKEVGFRLFTVTHCHCGVAICHGESRVYTRFFFLYEQC